MNAVSSVTDERVLHFHQEVKAGLRERLVAAIAAHCEVSKAAVEIVSRAGMTPRVEVSGQASAEWHVSLSRTRRCFVGVISLGQSVGVDAEWIDPGFRWELVAKEFFPPELSAMWSELPPEAARREFYGHWVRWEAALKCRGTGFGAGHLPPAAAAEGLSFLDLDLGVGHVGCIALAPATF